MKKRNLGIMIAVIISCVMISGCGSSGALSMSSDKSEASYDTGGGVYASYDMAAADNSEAAASEEAPMESGAEILEENTKAVERKLIKTVDLSVETEEYDDLLANLDKQIAALGGYIEYQNQYNGSYYSSYQETRNAYMQIRIPVESLDEFVLKVGEWTNITNKEERVEDVTLQYVDLESRKKALITEQERLLELLEQAESVEDIISIEQRLSDVRYELESMESQLRTLNNQIDYSTINLSIQEVRRLTPTQEKSVWDKIRNGFIKTIYNIGDDIESGFIWFVINIPYFIIWIVIIIIAFVVFRRFRNRKRMKTAKEEPARNVLGTDDKEQESAKEDNKAKDE